MVAGGRVAFIGGMCNAHVLPSGEKRCVECYKYFAQAKRDILDGMPWTLYFDKLDGLGGPGANKSASYGRSARNRERSDKSLTH